MYLNNAGHLALSVMAKAKTPNGKLNVIAQTIRFTKSP
jgi:hypothetical protein